MKIYLQIKRHFQFVFAKYFRTVEEVRFSYVPTRMERWGDRLLSPFNLPLETLLKFFNWQLVLIALVFGLFIGVTLFYYPDLIATFIEKIVPIFNREYIKFFFFLVVQLYLNGLLLRTLGRLSNQSLLQAWINGHIHSHLPGQV